MAERRPAGYPKLKNYKPSRFMLPTSHYDKAKADRAVKFIENLCHTKGKWAGKRFWLLPWQEQLIRDIFGIVKPDGYRQFRTAFVEICKKVGKSELAAAVALYLLYADNEPSAEVYGAAADRQQASIVFDVAKQMVEMSPALLKRSKLMTATKRIVNYGNSGYYQVLSAEVGGKHGFSVSGLVFDEIHTQPNRQLYDVLTKGSSDARQNPLHFIITTAGTDRHSIAYELHTKAVDILEGRRVDPTFYPVVYGLKDDEDWEDEANWYKVNPSLGYTVDIERLRDAYREAKQNPADEVTFKWLRLNMWVSSTVAWIPDAIFMKGNEEIDNIILQGAIVTAVNDAYARRNAVISLLKTNIQETVFDDLEARIAAIDEQLAELQQQMIDNSGDNALVEELGLQMDDLRGDRQDILAEAAGRTDLQARMNDMIAFLEEMPAAVTEYSETLARRLVDRITIFDEKIVVELKSGLQMEVEE